jgi:hypothetical protein
MNAGDGKVVPEVLREVRRRADERVVEWFNQVDAAYRGKLREQNELNFARFDAKLEQRLAELRADLRTGLAVHEAGLARLEGGLLARIGMAEGRLARLTLTLTLTLWVATLGTLIALLKL